MQDERGEDRREGEKEDKVAPWERVPSWVLRGTARAAASETAPRMPLQTITKRSCHGERRYLPRKSLSKIGWREGVVKNQAKRVPASTP
ncbi:MAG: hypothetical protein M3316_01225 [Actinomycetota bacterium]|nr:hypothetical protein [Actinomycetota bacterium]